MYNIIHFEALGKEADYLEEYTKKSIESKALPEDFKYLITSETVQSFLKENPDIELPDLITTKTHSVLPEEYYNSGNKKSLITRSAGYDHCEHLADKMNIASLREYCVAAVAQTAIKFVYQTCGFYNEYAMATPKFERNKVVSFWELDKGKTAVVFGVGKIGKKIYDLLQANDLTVLAVDIREEELKKLDAYKNVIFTSKEEALKRAVIIVNAMNLTRNSNSRFYNYEYFSKEDFKKGKNEKVFINITRGEIAPEKTLVDLYNEGILVGLGLDVFSSESDISDYLNGLIDTDNKNILSSKLIIDRAIDKSANFYVQPHQAFNSDLASAKKAEEALNHVVYWYENKKFAEQLPYYI